MDLFFDVPVSGICKIRDPEHDRETRAQWLHALCSRWSVGFMTAASQLIDPAYLSGHFVFAAFASAFLLKVS
jgi:hypothetical protein